MRSPISRLSTPEWQSPQTAFAPCDHRVDIWRIRLSDDGPRQQSHRARDQILRRYLALNDQDKLTFATKAGGKPFISQPPGATVQCNLSHSHRLALLVVSPQWPVGVDVERLRRISDPVRIAERVFPEARLAELLAAPTDLRSESFFFQWTRFEAIQKLAGHGIFGPAVPEDTITASSFCPLPDYVACVAVDVDVDQSIVFRHFEHNNP